MKALEAVMDGFRVLPMLDASEVGDIFISATGDINVIDTHHFERMKSGRNRLQQRSLQRRTQPQGIGEKLHRVEPQLVRPFVEEYRVQWQRDLYSW